MLYKMLVSVSGLTMPTIKFLQDSRVMIKQNYPTGESLGDVVWKTFVLDHADADGRKAPSQ
jgi:hypothetical protein